jgi:hypothetical protein
VYDDVAHVYDDVTHVYDDVTHAYDDVTHVSLLQVSFVFFALHCSALPYVEARENFIKGVCV